MSGVALPQEGAAIGVLQSKPTVETITVLDGMTGGELDNTPIHFGTSSVPITQATAANFNDFYGESDATTGDTRMIYARTVWTSTGSGETLRAFSQVTGANGATGGTINGAHISMYVNGSGTISGAGNGLRVTLGGTSTAPGGTLAALQLDSDFASGGSWTGASYIRCTNSGTGTIDTFAVLPNAMIATKTSAAVSQVIPIKNASGTTYYIMVSDTL